MCPSETPAAPSGGCDDCLLLVKLTRLSPGLADTCTCTHTHTHQSLGSPHLKENPKSCMLRAEVSTFKITRGN